MKHSFKLIHVFRTGVHTRGSYVFKCKYCTETVVVQRAYFWRKPVENKIESLKYLSEYFMQKRIGTATTGEDENGIFADFDIDHNEVRWLSEGPEHSSAYPHYRFVNDDYQIIKSPVIDTNEEFFHAKEQKLGLKRILALNTQYGRGDRRMQNIFGRYV